jgi:hypothetical protein
MQRRFKQYCNREWSVFSPRRSQLLAIQRRHVYQALKEGVVKSAITALLFVCAVPVSAQQLSVKIIDRQDHDTDYSYVVPGHVYATSNANVNCSGTDVSVNCSGSSTTNGSSTPAQDVPFYVRGATFSLRLPDGRVAVVNCDAKFAEHFAGPRGNHRSCRQPIVDDIEADFHGDNAKLEWPVSLDGKKKQAETYKVLGILDKPKDAQK